MTMAPPAEQLQPELPHDSELERIITELHSYTNPSDQLEILNYDAKRYAWKHGRYASNDVYTQEGRQAAETFAELAADETLNLPAMVRIEALERALELGYASDMFDAFDQKASDITLFARSYDVDRLNYAKEFNAARSYRFISERLIHDEHLSDQIYFPDETETDIDRGGRVSSDNPVLAMMFLDSLRDADSSPEMTQEYERFSGLASKLNQELTQGYNLPSAPDIALRDWWKLDDCISLLKYGDNYGPKLVELVESDNPIIEESLRLLGEINTMSGRAAGVFPEQFRQGVAHGLRQITADAFYATLQHVENNSITDELLPLNGGGDGLLLQLSGEEPIALLEAYNATIKEMADAGHYSFSMPATVRLNRTGGYGVYRLMQRNLSTAMSVYVRPRGGHTYDQKMEYGRPGEGVEASIGYIVDVDNVLKEQAYRYYWQRAQSLGKLPKVGKPGKDDDRRISIRLDREGVAPNQRHQGVGRDPTQKQGTLSLDVGSVIGKDDWIGVKLGRFLAWGNKLRTQEGGQETHLNHVTDYFTEQDGDAEYFAKAADALLKKLEANRLSTEDIAVIMANQAKPVARAIG